MPNLKHRFTYKFLGDDTFSRPYIPVSLKHGEKSLPILALLDSGADYCMFDAELTSILGLDLIKMEKTKMTGVGGEAECFVTRLPVCIEDTCITVPVLFSSDFSPNGFGGVIGQIGFFDRFIISFDRAKKDILLKQ